MRKILLEANRAKSTGERIKALAGLRPSMFVRPLLPRNSEPRTNLSMGEHCEQMAKRWGIRREDRTHSPCAATRTSPPPTNAASSPT
jgi:acetyl-CoA C-acetyltransferase